MYCGLYPSPVIAEEEIPSELTWISNLPFELCIPFNHIIRILPPSAFVTVNLSSSWIFAHLLEFCPLSLGPIPCILVLVLNNVLCTCALMDHRREGVGSSVRSSCVQGGNHRAHTSLSAAGGTVLEAGCKSLLPGITTSMFPSPHLWQRFRRENIFLIYTTDKRGFFTQDPCFYGKCHYKTQIAS